MVTKESIVELYLSEKGLSLRCWGVASRLENDLNETLRTMDELLGEKVLYRRSGYYQLNLPHLWKNPQFVEKYGKRTEEIIVSSARDVLAELENL